MRRGLKLLLVIFLVGLIFLAALVAAVCVRANAWSDPAGADCIIILGARVKPGGALSDTLRYRTESALAAYQEGIAEKIIVSGGQGSDEPTTEAEAMKNWLVKNGVQKDDIFLEDASTDTWENLQNSKKIMDAQGFSSAIIVTSDYHLQRAMWIAADVGIDAEGLAAQSPKPFSVFWFNRIRESISWIFYGLSRVGFSFAR